MQNAEKQKSFSPFAFSLIAICVLGMTACRDSRGNKADAATSTDSPQLVSSVARSLDRFRGKVVLLDLWATWCPPCRMEIPGLIELQKKYGAKGFSIVGVSLDPIDPRGGGGAAAVGPFMQRMGINYPVWMIENYAAVKGYEMGPGYPTVYLIARDGHIVKQYVGLYPEEVFEKDIESVL